MKWLVWFLCILVLFYGLGKAQLFEPDEGRNAEIAREVLVTGDWVTPHDDFLPALDKPMPFYWLIAIAYKAFGISEGPARLPSALAALGCLVLVYGFCRSSFGSSTALWSLLLLTTSVEFFVLSHVVIFDMALTFCISLALFSFYAAARTERARSRGHYYFLMYAAMGAGALIKGPVGLVIPVIVIGAYLCLAKKTALIWHMELHRGALIVLAIVVPWYAWVEVRNPGYLKYFFWEEHFLRFFTDHFNRSEPWYYFFLVLCGGFLPWTLALPAVARDLWRERLDDPSLFLVLWLVLPIMLFSLSSAKLPHYILPVFPPLAILTGCCLERHLVKPGGNITWLLTAIWLVEILSLAYFTFGSLWPNLLPGPIRPIVFEVRTSLWIFACAIIAMLGLLPLACRRNQPDRVQKSTLSFFFISMLLVPLVVVQIMAAVSQRRSAKDLAVSLLAVANADDQLVLYDTYLGGLLFYLKVSQPIWLVWSGSRSNIMGSWYVAEKQPPSPKGKVLCTFEEFDQAWRNSNQRLLVYLKDRHEARLDQFREPAPRELARTDGYRGYVLVANR